ncbi:hypothetical protein ONZ43_g3807 [Nemania bipapillata]|uniref:Uncharacterized protein n=1 Tax=Nemania bipapillata TaxID=110536 RepID=A0ACC2IVS2_9PEZI|nr:hypothetical protein ONZ43_g3807 [Nemania bipapillata]
MLLPIVGGSIAAALLANGVSSATVLQGRQVPLEACTAHLMIDDFASWANGENSLKGATSDDATLNSTSTEGDILTFTPKRKEISYVYEQFECIDAVELGYDSVSFTIKGPEAASVSLELQTKADYHHHPLE